MLEISTGHVTNETCNGWIKANLEDGFPRAVQTEFGWFIYTGWVAEDEEDDPMQRFPEDLRCVVTFARNLNCRWLHLDCDADTIDKLPLYKW
jgi:hypothetical protein